MKWVICVMVFFLLTAIQPARAASPALMPVQGRLTDAGGLAVNGQHSVSFGIYDSPAGGTLLWSESQQVTFDNGLFTVELGTAEPLNLFLFKDRDDLWLGVAVEGDPEFRRLRLATTPFAAYATHGGYTGGPGISITAANVIESTLGDTIESQEITDATILPEDLSPEARPQVDWMPLDINLGSPPYSNGTNSYDLPASVPAEAREVLVFLFLRRGGGGFGAGGHIFMRVYTQEGTTQYAKKLVMITYANSAITYNSDNLWLPVTSDRQVHVEYIGEALNGDHGGGIEILGYR